MPSAETLLPFFLASAVFAFVPGPGMLYAAARTLALGRRAGWWSALGFHLAGFGHVLMAAFGVSALLALTPALFVAMKFAGAACLIWMGIRHLFGPQPPAPAAGKAPASSGASASRDAFVVEVLNPKSALFFLAFLPQFADASAVWPVWAQIVALGLIVNAMFTASDAILIEAAHALATRFRESARSLKILRGAGGGILILLGVRLALERP